MPKCRSTATGLIATALILALGLGGCGGDSNEREVASTTTTQEPPASTGSQTTTAHEPGGKKGKAKKRRKHRAGSASGKGDRKAQPGGQKAAGAKHSEQPKQPKQPTTTTTPTGPPDAKAVFGLAKGMCANPALLETIPEALRQDDETIARYAETYAPPGQKKAAHDGCLAGLRSGGE